jgi:hypothetical protein
MSTRPAPSPDSELLRLCADYMRRHADLTALWPPGDADPSPATEAAITRAERRMGELHDAICSHQPVSLPGRLALARVALCHVAKDDSGEPLSDRDLPLVALAGQCWSRPPHDRRSVSPGAARVAGPPDDARAGG